MKTGLSRLGREMLLVLGASVALAIVLAFAYRSEYLNTDTAQYIVTARHLLRGEGLSTNLLYFEDQLRPGQMPAPQTTWPPGYPLLLAALMAAGVPDLYAPFVIALLADMLLPLVVFFVLRKARCANWVCAAGALTTLSMVFPHVLVLRGLTESTYTSITVLGLLAMAHAAADPQRELRPLLWAGVAAACAFLTRYAGIAFIGALGGFLLVRWLQLQGAQRFWRYALVGAIPVLSAGALFFRNWWLVRNAYGGPDIAHGAEWSSVVRRLGWGFQDLLGVVPGTWVRVLQVLVVAALAYVAVGYWAARRQKREAQEDENTAAVRSAVLAVTAWYAVATIAMLAYLGHRRFAELISARYLAPLLPFVVCSAGVAFERLRATFAAPHPMRRLLVPIASGFAVALFAIQLEAAARAVSWFTDDEKYETIEAALRQPYGQSTVGDLLRQRTSKGEALLDVDGQLLGLLLDRPAVGLSEATWTWRTWTEEEVRNLVATFNVSVISYFPTLFRSDDPLQQHRVFYHDLAAGRVPDWLTLEVDTPLIKLYGVRSPGPVVVSEAGEGSAS